MTVKKKLLVVALMLAFSTLTVQAQTTIAASLYGAYRSATSFRNATVQNEESPSVSSGVLLEVRHIKSSLIGYEATYSYNPANEFYAYENDATPCPADAPGNSVTCIYAAGSSIHAVAHEFTGDWIFSFKHGNVRPFAILGAGLLVDTPTEGHVPNSAALFSCTGSGTTENCTSIPVAETAYTQIDMKPLFVYGGGWDWSLTRHLGFRFQYRGIVHKGPALSTSFPATGQLTQDVEPMIGVYYKF